MNVYTCTSFRGVWPVGVSAVVVAMSAEDAARLLSEELRVAGLPQVREVDPAWMTPVDIRTEGATILQDGDY